MGLSHCGIYHHFTFFLPPVFSYLTSIAGADIIMQLDDVVHSKTTGPRVEEAMWRSVWWLDRCIAAHRRTDSQNLFGIVQGGLQPELRRKCVEGEVKMGGLGSLPRTPPSFLLLWEGG